MRKLLEIVLLVALPLAWGLSVEFVFERLRQRRSAGRAGRGEDRQ